MKVAHILNELRHSGAETMLTSAAPYFLQDNEMIIISTGQIEGDYASTLREAGYQILHFPYSKSFGFFRSLGQALCENHVNMIHFHTEKAAVWYALMARFYGIRSIRTIHNEFKFSALLRARRIVSRHVAEAAGTIHVSCSPSVQRNEYHQFRLKTKLINNWMDPRRVPTASNELRDKARSSLGLRAGQIVALSIANEAPAKNLGTLFEGVMKSASEGVAIRLYHCGHVSEELRSMVAGDPNRCIVLLGTVSDISVYLSASDLFISTSLNEGGQISLLEAAAAGLLCITTKVGNSESFSAQEGVNFIEPTVESLVDEIRNYSLLDQRSTFHIRSDLSEWTRTYFVPDRGAGEYLNLYQGLN